MAKIELKKITKKYGENTVVKSIDLTVPDGRMVSILGPSGCGKTTTLRMIAGFESPDEGEIYFDDEPISKINVNKRNIGMVFQSYALFPHMTVFENIAYGLEQRKIDVETIKAKVQTTMQMVHLEQYANRKPKQLSGGQQQRVALARALVIEPKVLLLDECLSALDKKLRVEMQAELRRIYEETHVTTFFVTHDQEEAMTLSDYIVVMNDGVIEQMGTPYEVYERPRNMFVAGFLGKANFFEQGGLLFAVRPEKICAMSGRAEDAILRGKIKFVTYSGNITGYTVEILENCSDMTCVFPEAEENVIFVEQQNALSGQSVTCGEEVYLSWSKNSMIPLERQCK